jgi:hypothetical protein
MPGEHGKPHMRQQDRSAFLPDDVIMRELRRIRYSSRHERQARRAPSLAGLAAQAGLSVRHLHYLLTGQLHLTDHSRYCLSLPLRNEE